MTESTSRTVAHWVLQQRAGSGSFAVVWKAVHRDTGKIVAIKEISTDRLNKKLKQSLESEVSILKQIRHKNIVHLEDVVEVTLTTASSGWAAAAFSLRTLLLCLPLLRVEVQQLHFCQYRSPVTCTWSWSTVLGVT